MEALYKKMPSTPGVYLMKGSGGKLLYVGKAVNLKRRVASYFLRPHDSRIQRLVSEIRKIEYKSTDSALEALILEAELIKKLQPPYNIREKDDKSFLCIEITKEKFPRLTLVRAKDKDLKKTNIFGPFVSASSVKEALRIVRKIFPYSIHPQDLTGKFKRPCFDYDIGLCPGVCVNAIERSEYLKTIKNIKLILSGKKKRLIASLKKDMKAASKNLEFEKAEKIRRQIFSLEHIRDTALISEDSTNYSSQTIHPSRIEGYDISNISGSSAVGSMVVFKDGEPDKNEYRKFKIKTVIGANDVGMMEEVIRRRFSHNSDASVGAGWPLPDLILVDGGLAQVGVAEAVIKDRGLNIPVVGLAKGPERKRNDLVGKLPAGFSIGTLIQVRDEAHRFAVAYHRKVRNDSFLR